MANEQERGGPEDLGQDPFVERLRPDPSQPPERVRILEGLLGDSDREGYKRLYFTRELDSYAEFRAEDVVYSESIPPDQSPLLGQQATRVGIRWDATIEFSRTRAPRPVDEFDLDIRLAAATRGAGRFLAPQSLVGPPCDDCTGLLTGCNDTRFGPRCETETEAQTRCFPCDTAEQTRCVPCDTAEQTRCVPCDTRVQTRCVPCDPDTDFCPTRATRCPTNFFRCPRTDEPPGCV
jgi:hypothetical protein